MSKDDEQVLVVSAEVLFKDGCWQGMKKDNLDDYLSLIKNNIQFKRRGDMEKDPSFKQIIPYMLFSCGNEFFVYKYIKGAGEQRLVNNDYQLGVGGHINQEDVGDSKDVLETGMMREWDEEVTFRGNILEKKLVGIVNDDSRPVEQVHLGLVYHFVGDSKNIQIKETDKMEGMLLKVNELAEGKVSRSPWMDAVYRDYLKNYHDR